MDSSIPIIRAGRSSGQGGASRFKVYESRGKLQIQLLYGADDNPRGRMDAGG